MFQNFLKKCTCDFYHNNDPELVQEKVPSKKTSQKKIIKKDSSELLLLQGHTDGVRSVAFHPQGDKIASGSDDKTVRIWNVKNGKEIAKYENKERISSIGFLSGGEKLVCGGIVGLSVWDLRAGKEVSKTKNGFTHLQISSIDISKKGNRILSGSWGRDGEHRISLWDLNLDREIKKYEGHTKWVNTIAFSHMEDKIVSGSSDGAIRLWNVSSGKQTKRNVGFSCVNSTKFSKKGDIILSGGDDGIIKQWNLVTEEEKKIKAHRFSICSVIFSPQEDLILSGSKDNTIKLWEAKSGREIKKYEGHEEYISSISFNPKGDKIVSGSLDGNVRVWKV